MVRRRRRRPPAPWRRGGSRSESVSRAAARRPGASTARPRALRNLLLALSRLWRRWRRRRRAARVPASAVLLRVTLMAAPAQLFFNTITNGFGVMYAYGSRIPPRDRWAIIAYIRALQQSRSANLAATPDEGAAQSARRNPCLACPRRAAFSLSRWRPRSCSQAARSLPPSPSRRGQGPRRLRAGSRPPAR